MEDQLTITRSNPGGIPLADWLRYLATSTIVHPVPPREGINPFTKQATVFKPPAGAAVFHTARGDCFIEYRDGALLVGGATEHGMAVVREIARAMHAAVTPVA